MDDRSGGAAAGGGPVPRWLTASGVGVAVGALVWLALPWAQFVALGSRPYVATWFDVVGVAAWLLVLGGLPGVRRLVAGDRIGRVALPLLAVGMALVLVVEARSVAAFVGAGFRAVPATGEDPAGLVVTWTLLLGYALSLSGMGLVGVSLRRRARAGRLTVLVLLSAPVLAVLLLVARLPSLVPAPVGTALVRGNLFLAPFGLGWVALGRLLWIDPGG